jgi:hypothetical protein
MGKEDSLVKMLFTPVLLAIGCIAVLGNAQAMAQDTPKPAAALVPSSPSAPQNGVPATGSPQTAGPTQNGAASPEADGSLLIDNGLWAGADVGPCCAICGGGSCSPPDWYTQQGVRFFGRTRPRGIALGYDESIVTDEVTSQPIIFRPEVMSNRTPSPDFTPSYNMTIGHYFARDALNRDNFVEFTFWGLDGFRDEASINATRQVVLEGTPIAGMTTGSLASAYYFNPDRTSLDLSTLTGYFVFGFDGANSYHTFFSSYNQNFEINGRISPRNQDDRLVLDPSGRWRRECQPGMYMSYLYGIRFMQIDDSFQFHGQGIYDAGSGPTPYAGDYDVVAHNNLLGLQFGADMTFRQCKWDWGIKSKLGPYVNFADSTSNIKTGPVYYGTGLISNGLDWRLASSKHVASLIGELSFAGSYKFRPNLVGHASYDFMWITGLASSPEQLQFTVYPVDKINTNGTIFYHGPSLGLEWLW